MTRFARAKGSKASNERAPEEGTPWAVMKEQLVRAKHDVEEARMREQAEKQRLENYEKFLKEHKTAKRKSTWCEFPEDNKKPKRAPEALAPVQQHAASPRADLTAPKKKKKNKITSHEETGHSKVTEEAVAADTGTSKKKKKKKCQQKNIDNPNEEGSKHTEVAPVVGLPEESASEQSTQNRLSKKQKRKNKIDSSDDINEHHSTSITTADSQTQSKKQIKKGAFENVSEEAISQPGTRPPPSNQKKRKSKGGVATRRKAESDSSFQIIINGREVELARCDGFPVMRRDAERLEELRRSMAGKGIPKSEVQRTMKLERRRAEKALARLKRDVCYNCRKGGHNLSDCPELRGRLDAAEGAGAGGGGAADGVCFKCGSTEHRQFECRVRRGDDFRFASCFICKEQGHIARQCPDNPKGLYPNGGGCKLCGDVTHLRKDCPTTKSEREETSVRLDTLAGAADVEGVAPAPAGPAAAASTPAGDRKPKKIKF